MMPFFTKKKYSFDVVPRKKPSVKELLVRFHHGPLLGILYSVAASLFITFSSVLIKKVTLFDPWQQSLLGSIWVLVGSIPILVFTRQSLSLSRKHRLLMTIRAALAVNAAFFNTLAFRYLPMAEASIIVSATPGVAAIAARIFLKEPCGLVQSSCLVLTIGGALLAVRVPELMREGTGVSFSTQDIMGIACAVCYVIFNSVTFILMRVMKDIHFSIHMFHIGVVGVVESACVAAVMKSEPPRCGPDSFLMMSSGLSAFIGYCFITLAVQTQAVVIATVVRSSADVVFSVAFQVALFLQFPDAYSGSGAVIVILAAVAVGLRKWLLQLPEEAGLKAKKYCKFILY